jgi:hypothetical protein
LELCEHQVFIEEYGKYCEKAIANFYSLPIEKWIEENQWLFNHIDNKIDCNKECECNNDDIMKISNSLIHVFKDDIVNNLHFHKLFKEASSSLN